MSFRSCQLKGQWSSNPVHISITLIASTKQRSHMQVSSSHHCERTILSKVAIFERVRSMQSVSFAMLKVDKFGRRLRRCVKKILWLLMPSSDGLQDSTHYRESRCLFQFRARMSRGLNTFCHAERTIVQWLSGLAS